jgi:hypothetical protein
VPTIVKGTGGVLRIDFVEGERSGGRSPRLEQVSWEQWFDIFDDSELTFLCSTDEESRFFKLVSSDVGDGQARGRGRPRGEDAPEPAVLVIQQDGAWMVGLENDEGSLESYRTKAEALRHARELAEENAPTEILVETSEGEEEHISYGDPSAPGAG